MLVLVRTGWPAVVLTNTAPLPMEEALPNQARVPTESMMSMC
jgi:hypothetical protein